MKSNFSPFPEIQTERLLLRQTVKNDREDVFFLRSNEEVNKFIRRKRANSLKEAEDFIEKITEGWKNEKNINWSIFHKGNPNMIGSICLWNFSADRKIAEVGYDLKPIFHNQGIMTEALQAILKFGFESLYLFQIEAFTDHRNKSSTELLKRNGFSLNDKRKDEDDLDNIIFELKKQTYFHSEQSSNHSNKI